MIVNVQTSMAYQAGVPACLRHDTRYQRPATAGVPIRGRLPGHLTSKHRTITLAQASKAAEASSAESPQALALYLEGQSMVKEMAERPLEELQQTAFQMPGVTVSSGKLALSEAIVEAQGLPFTNRLGAAINFDRLAESTSNSPSEVEQARAFKTMLESPAFVESQQMQQSLMQSTVAELQVQATEQGLAKGGTKIGLVEKLLEARGLPFVRQSDGVPVNLIPVEGDVGRSPQQQPSSQPSSSSSAAVAEPAEAYDSAAAEPEQLHAQLLQQSKAELVKRLQECGLKTTGVKAELASRLEQHLLSSSSSSSEPDLQRTLPADLPQEQEAERPSTSSAQDPLLPIAAEEVEEEAGAEVPGASQEDLESWTVKDLRALLGKQGVNTKGRKPALISRARALLLHSAGSPSAVEPPSPASPAGASLTMDQWQAHLAARASPAQEESAQSPAAREPELPDPEAGLVAAETSQTVGGEPVETNPARLAADQISADLERAQSRPQEEASALQGIQAAEDEAAASAQDGTDVSPEIMSNAGRQLPQEAEEGPELETEILDPNVQARSDRPTDPAAAEQLSSPNMDLQDPGTDFRRDAFELQQTDDVSTQEDSAQALGQATDDDLQNTDLLDEMAILRDNSDGDQIQMEREQVEQDNELEGARNADIDTDTDVELGLNVDMSEFEGDKDVEAEALHDEEDEELAQAAFDLQQPDALDNDIDAMVGSMDEDTQDPVEAFADQGDDDEDILTSSPADQQDRDEEGPAASAPVTAPTNPNTPRDAEHALDLPSLAPNLLPRNTVAAEPIPQDAYRADPPSQQAEDTASPSQVEASLQAGSTPPASGQTPASQPTLGSSIPRPGQTQSSSPVAMQAQGDSSSDRQDYEQKLIRSNSFQEYGRRERKEDEGSMEDAADKQYNEDLDEEMVEDKIYAKLDADAAALSQAKNIEREMLDRVKQDVTESMDMGAVDAAARERYLLDMANEMDMGELEAKARDQYDSDMAAEIEKGNIEQSKREQMDADLIAEYRMSSIEDDIKSRIASDMESELSKGELEDNFKARLARELKDELDSGSFEDEQRQKMEEDWVVGLQSMEMEDDAELDFQMELEQELGRPYKSAREAAADMLQERLVSSTGSASPNLAEAQDAAPSDPAPPDQSSPELTTDVASTAKAAAAEVDQQQPQQNGDPQASLATPPAEPAEQLQSGLAAVEEDLGQLQAEADQAAESAEAVEGEAELEETELTPAEIRYQAEQAGLAEEASRQAEQKPVGVGDELLPQLLVGSQPAADQQPAQDQGFPELIDMSAEFDRYLELEEQQQQQQQQGLQLPAVDTDVDALPTRSSTAAQPGPVEGSEAAEPEPLPVEAATDLQPSTEQPDEATDGSPPDTEKPGEDGSSQGSRPSGLPPGLAQGVQEESEVVSALRRQVAEKTRKLSSMQDNIDLLTYSSKSRNDLLLQVQEQLTQLRSRQDHDLRETLAGDVADLRAAAGRSQAEAPVKREVLNELNGLDQQLAVLDAELSQKEGLATQLHRQLAGVRERLARQGRAPLPGPALQEPPRKVNGTHLPSLKSNGPAADVPEGHLFESADTDQGSASRTSPAVFLTAGVLGVFGAARKIFQRPPKLDSDEPQ